MDDEENQIRGYTHVNDESGLTMGHLSAWSLTDIRNMLRCIQNSTPMRHKETHFVNIPSCANKIIEFAISLLNDKLKARISVRPYAVLSIFLPLFAFANRPNRLQSE